jgi:hypothetical protein
MMNLRWLGSDPYIIKWSRTFSKIIEYDTAHMSFNSLGTPLEELLVVHEGHLIKKVTQLIVDNASRMIQNRRGR